MAQKKTPKHSNHQKSYDYDSARVYDDDETEFILAVEKYRQDGRIRFLHITEYLYIAKKLGYKKC